MTDWRGLVLHRARAAGTLLATLFALVAVTTAMIAGVLGQSATLATQSARTALASPDVGLQVSARLGPDPAAQDALARQRLSSGFAPAPVVVWSSSLSEPQDATGPAGALSGRVVLAAGPLFQEGILYSEGTAPASPGEAALQQSAAAALGVKVGDELTVQGKPLEVTALWRVADPTAQRWLGDPLITGGADATGVGPLLVDPGVLAAVGDPFARWTVLPDVERITASQLGTLTSGAQQVTAQVTDADVSGRGVTVTGDLAGAAKEAGTARAVGDGFRLVPLSVLLLVAVVGLVQVAGLLGVARERETSLFFARGAMLRQVAGIGVLEAAAVSLAGTLVGTGVAVGVVAALAGSPAQTGTVVAGGLVGFVLSFLCLGGVTVRAAGRGDGHRGTDRVRSVAGAATLVLVCVLAALATWQLRRTGRFLSVDDGSVVTDVVASLAPALLIAATAVVALILLAPLTRLLELATSRAPAPQWLAGAQLGRALRVQAVPVVLTVLATSLATFSAFFSGSSAALEQDLDALNQGAPLRATYSTEVDPAAPALNLPGSNADGVVGAVPVWQTVAAQIGNLNLPALAAPTGDLAQIATLPAGGALPDLSPTAPGPGIAVPAGTTSLEVAVDATANPATPLSVELRLRDDSSGLVSLVDVGPFTADGSGRVSEKATVALAPGSDAVIDAATMTASGADNGGGRGHITVSGGGTTLLDAAPSAWEAVDEEWVSQLLKVGDETSVPIALTRASAEQASLKVGDKLTVSALGQRFPAQVASLIDDLPGVPDGSGILIDSVALARSTAGTAVQPLAPTGLWAGVEGSTEQARAALASQPGVASVSAPATDSGIGPTAAAAGSLQIAAVGAMVLAVTGLAAACATQLRSRRPEVAVLRALGMTPGSQARSRAWETGAVLVLAGALGIAGGFGVAALTVGPLALSTGVAGTRPVHLTADWPPMLTLLGVGVLAVAGVVVALSAAVARQAHDNEYREEVR